MAKRLRTMPAVVVVALLVSACASSTTSPSASTPAASAPPAASASAGASASAAPSAAATAAPVAAVPKVPTGYTELDQSLDAAKPFNGKTVSIQTQWIGGEGTNFAAALAAFEGLMREYPGTRKAPDALLKAGYCQFELKQAVAARATLNRVVQEFPDSPAAVEARSRLDRIGAQGG